MVHFASTDLYPVDLSTEEHRKLIEYSFQVRKKILEMITHAQSGHPGGSLSCTDILTCLYQKVLNHFPSCPDHPNRDFFVLSKGHAAPALYTILAKEGYYPENELKYFRTFGSMLQGHPKADKVPGIEVSTGSLGMGASIGIGLALAAKLDQNDRKVYVLLGDGECNEGIVWESAMSASQYKLDNLVYIIDRNAVQLDGATEDIMSIEPLASKWESFGWHVIEVDGNSFEELLKAFETARELRGKPTVIIAYMIKGQGVKFMHYVKEFHGRPPTEKQYQTALKELKSYKNKLIKKIENE